MTISCQSVRISAFVLLLAASNVALSQAPPPVPEPQLSALPAPQQAELRKIRAEFDAAIGALQGEQRAVAFLQLGSVYLRSGLVDAGNIALDHAVSAQPKDPRFVYLRGIAALRQRQASAAAAAFAQTVRIDPTYLPAHYHLAEIQITEGNLQAARATLTPLLAKRPELAPALALIGEIDLREKRFDASIKHLNAALKIEPQADALYARLAIAHEGRGDVGAATDARALAGVTIPLILDPLALELDGQGIRSAVAAPTAGAAVRVNRATLEQSVRTAPRDLDARIALVEHLALAGESAAARTHSEAAVSLAPGSFKVLMVQAILAEVGGDDAAARSLLAKAVAADASQPVAQQRYGDSLMRARQFDNAFTHYLAAAGPAGETQALASATAAASLANRCDAVLPALRHAVSKRGNDGRLAQIEVRAIAGCPIATTADRARMAPIAQALYRQNPDGEHAETLAMALAATGKGREAVDYEAEAIFDATKRGDSASLAGRRTWLKLFERNQSASRPWPEGNLLYAPPALRAATARPASIAPAR